MNGALDLITLVIMWSLGVVCLIVIILLTILLCLKKFTSRVNNVMKVLLLFAFIGIYFSLPYYIYSIAFVQADGNKQEDYLKFAAKIAVIPALKSSLYDELSGFYILHYKGKEAIEAYEKAASIPVKSEPLHKGLICYVYFWKGDSENVHKTCTLNTIAIDYMRNGDYANAIKTAAESVDSSKSDKGTNLCYAHAIRAVIYRNMEEKDLAKKDSDFVYENCQKVPQSIKYIEVKDILDLFAGGREYGAKFRF